MNVETPLNSLREYLHHLLSESESDFLVDVKINPGNNIKVLLDADNGITIERCAQVNKALYKFIEETGLFGDSNFSLEVSSPGLDEPLKLVRQYRKNTGRSVEVESLDGSRKEGKLIEVNDDGIVIAEKKGKGNKSESNLLTILFNQIKHTKVLVTF